jgi:hypothetical protein
MDVRDCIDGKSECRNPKFETMSKIQNPNDQNVSPDGAIVFRGFGFLSFEFVSVFEIRISNFGSHPFTFPIGVNRATGLLIPASSVAAITSLMSL